jgi:dTDP-4-dehydrorhamnose 3,5-epimerase
VEFVQDNHSRSVRGTIRALHFQLEPGQAKLIRVARGSIYDVAVDLRRDSPTYGQYEAFELSDDNAHQIFIPVGFAHGFCVTSEEADVAYKVSSYYEQPTERGIAWDDPDIGIPWPAKQALVSDRDRTNPRLADIAGELPW